MHLQTKVISRLKRTFNLLYIGSFLLIASGCGREATTAPSTNQPSSPSASIDAPRAIAFPQDEGAHYENPIEWWYLNAQLSDTSGKEYSFFFCVLSTGRHLAALFDKSANKVITKDYYESFNATQGHQSLHSASLKWKQTGPPFHYRIEYSFEGLEAQLDIKANKPPFLPGGAGFIRMGVNGSSHYYALTDLTISGSINSGTSQVSVKGSGWFDHQWGMWDWVEDFSQWKWFGIKLDNGVDLMLFNLYKNKQLIRSYCGYMDASGKQFHQLPSELITKQYFEDSKGGKWQKVVQLQFPTLTNTVLTLTSEHDLQFIEPEVLWEGSMTVEGTFKGSSVTGTAFGELNRPD